MTVIEHSANRAEVGVNGVQWIAGAVKRPNITGRRLGWNREVSFIHAEWLMNPARADVCDHACQTRGELLLHIEVPLRYIIALGWVYIRGPQLVGRKAGESREEGAWPGILDHGVGKERSSLGDEQNKLVRQRQHVKQSYSATNGRFAVAPGVPGKAHPGLEVLRGWIVEKRISKMRSSGRQSGQIRELATGLSRYGRHLITKTQIESEIRAEAPVILQVRAVDGLPHIARRKRAGNSTLELARVISQEIRQGVEVPNSIGVGIGEHIESHALRDEAEAQGMRALAEESVVIQLE